MSYEIKTWPKDFGTRTAEILATYAGDRDATMLMNCLLGLLVLPAAQYREKIPSDTSAKVREDWGLSNIKEPGKHRSWWNKNRKKRIYAKYKPDSIRGLVVSLRNAISHFKVRPIQHGDRKTKSYVSGFDFRDDNGFHARLTLEQIRKLSVQMAILIKTNSPT
jgi:hypothetical protein